MGLASPQHPRPGVIGALADRFRTCNVTGYQVYRPAERLIVANAVSAVVLLALGGALALLIALTRWQGVQLLPAELYYRFTSAHGIVMLVFWVVFFEVAALIFGATVLLNRRLPYIRLAWTYTGLMVAGALTTTITALSGHANNMFTAYPPLVNHPVFYLGIIVFAVGALLACCHFIYNVWLAKREGAITNIPLVVYALLTAAIIGIWTLLHGAAAYVPTLLQSLGLIEVDAAIYRTLFWGFGHGAQQLNLAAMVAAWYALATLSTGARPVHEGLSRFAFVLYLVGINMGAMHHLLVDPGPGVHTRIFNTSYFMYAALLGSLIHAFSIPAAIETAQRARGYVGGLFEWVRKGPWKEPGFSALMISFIGFGFIAGVSGVLMGVMQLNMLIHNTLFVPGHFHGTVVLGTTVAFMGLAYYVVPLVTRRDLAFMRLARWQPYIYGGGLLVLIAGLMLAGRMGASRRMWDMSFSFSPISVDTYTTPAMYFATSIIGLGAILAVAGGALFVLIMVATVFFGKRSDSPAVGHLGILKGEDGPESSVEIPEHDHAKGGFQAPGTVALAFIFLGWFVLMFLIAFFNLARVGWGVG